LNKILIFKLSEHLTALSTEANPSAIFESFFPHSHALIALGAIDQHITGSNRAFLLDDAALLASLTGSGMLFDEVDALDDDPLGIEIYLQNLTGLPPIITGKDHHSVAFFHLHTDRLPRQKP
jgi:hypothetical protein